VGDAAAAGGEAAAADVTPNAVLAARIARRIRREGPLSVAAFMAIALHDPEDGYYARREPIGRDGDFVTAPEISQIFGELIGLCLADWWHRAGRPEPVILAELGPGRGTLMADLLRATAAAAPDCRDALDLYLVEASPRLRAEQQRRLGAVAVRPHFVASADALPNGALLLVANEFLDALPIRQLVRGRTDWAERLVTLDDNERLVFADGPESPAATLLVPQALRDEPPGTLVEICPAAAALAAALGERLARAPGAALFIDYGHSASRSGPTLAAVRRHRTAAVLDDPGGCDLSAHVDFAAFAAAARAAGAVVRGPVPQGRFLAALGAERRLAALSERAATPGRRRELHAGLGRLIEPDQMGNLFRVVALTSPGLPAPAGFAGFE
jgi:NADH dehydrogenase [ubiquinone] 1 alpha subcomplex assembly factor 7